MNNSDKYNPYDSVGYLTGIADQYMRQGLIRKFKQTGYGITGEQWHILIYLYLNDGQMQKELSRLTGKSKVAIAKIINHLEESNLVVRIPNENDGRSKKVYLTPKGKKLEGIFVKIAKENLANAIKGLSPDDIETFKKSLRQIIANMKD